MIKIGITGSSGILGKSLISIFKKNRKYKVFNYKNNILHKHKLYNWVKQNQFQVIVHLAAVVATKKAKKNYNLAKKVNYAGTKNLVNAIKTYQKKKIFLFFSSSSHVYSFTKKKIKETDKIKGISDYGKTKVLAEKFLLKNKSLYNLCIGRISSLTSENQTTNFLIKKLINKGKKNKKIKFGNSNIKRDFIYVDDVSKIIKKIIEKKIIGIVNISNSQITHLSELFIYLKNKYGFIIDHYLNKDEYLVLSNKLLIKKIGSFRFLKIRSIIKKIYDN